MADVKPWGVKTTDDVLGVLAIAIGGGTAGDALTIKGVTLTPIAKGVSTVRDEENNIKAKTTYGATTSMFEVTADFEVKASLDCSNLFLGQCTTAGTWIYGISCKSQNNGPTMLSFKGRMGQTLESPASGKLNKWNLPAITIDGRTIAQDFGGGGVGGKGFSVDADTTINGSGFDFALEIQEAVNGEGTPISWRLCAPDGSLSADLAAFADLDAKLQPWTLDVAAGYLWANTSNPATAKAANEYWTGSASATLADPATSIQQLDS